MQNFVNESFALDMLRIGFNGTHVADSTDAKEYPNGEDEQRLASNRQRMGWR